MMITATIVVIIPSSLATRTSQLRRRLSAVMNDAELPDTIGRAGCRMPVRSTGRAEAPSLLSVSARGRRCLAPAVSDSWTTHTIMRPPASRMAGRAPG